MSAPTVFFAISCILSKTVVCCVWCLGTRVLSINGRRLALSSNGGGSFGSYPLRRRGVLLMTFSELMEFCLVILSVINLCVNISNNKKK